jgi:hypothetical protein
MYRHFDHKPTRKISLGRPKRTRDDNNIVKHMSKKYSGVVQRTELTQDRLQSRAHEKMVTNIWVPPEAKHFLTTLSKRVSYTTESSLCAKLLFRGQFSRSATWGSVLLRTCYSSCSMLYTKAQCSQGE